MITVRENGRERKISKQRGFVKALIAAAIKGDVRAINAVVAFSRTLTGIESDDPAEEADLEDFEFLESFVDRERMRRDRQKYTTEAAASETQPQQEVDNEDEDEI